MRRAFSSRLLALAGWALMAPLAVLAVLRMVAHDAVLPLVVANMFTTWLYVPAWGVLGVALLGRRHRLALVAATVAALHVLWVAPDFVSAEPPAATVTREPRLRVMTANLLGVNRDTAGIVSEVLAEAPDVLLVQELTPHWQRALDDPRLHRLLPHRTEIVRNDSFGIGIYASRPLQNPEIVEIDGLPLLRARLVLGERTVRVYNVHTLPPSSRQYARTWNRMMGELDQLLDAEDGAVVVAGDLNATTHARRYRELTDGRMRGVHEARGRGLATTWPNGVFSLPPVRLDHVLVSPELVCLDVREGEGRGSDHRPVVADLALL